MVASLRFRVACLSTGNDARVPRYVRVLTFIPYLIVLLFVVVIAMKVGWVSFLVLFVIWLVGSLLFASWLLRRSRRRAHP